MEHVIVRWTGQGYWLDATAYQAILHSLAENLPPGAREFALDPAHYDFYSVRCVKDLKFRSLSVDDAEGSTTLAFGPNPWKHEHGLTLTYAATVSISVDRQDNDMRFGWLGSLMLDELRPTPKGLIHEFTLTGGSLLIVAQDVEAAWG